MRKILNALLCVLLLLGNTMAYTAAYAMQAGEPQLSQMTPKEKQANIQSLIATQLDIKRVLILTKEKLANSSYAVRLRNNNSHFVIGTIELTAGAIFLIKTITAAAKQAKKKSILYAILSFLTTLDGATHVTEGLLGSEDAAVIKALDAMSTEEVLSLCTRLNQADQLAEVAILVLEESLMIDLENGAPAPKKDADEKDNKLMPIIPTISA